MRYNVFKHHLTIALCGAISFAGVALATAQTSRDALESLRSDLKADRNAFIAQEMKLSEQESKAFWPVYRAYRAEISRATDRIAELVLEYGDLYPNIPDEKAKKMLEEYGKIEAEIISTKRKYIKKLSKVLPAAKTFRFAQLDNRFDLATRITLAAAIPVLPASPDEAANKSQ